MPPLRLGTRKSALARTQSRWVAEQLRQHHPDLTVELVLITTSGDKLPSPPPSPTSRGRGSSLESPRPPKAGEGQGEGKGGLKAAFTKEIEDALLDKRIDLAVHSLKDMAAELPKGLIIGAIPLREDPRDAWISKKGGAFKDLPRGATIATGAVRRQAQIKHYRPDLEVIPIRGNVDTRLRKLQENKCDGLILALAGLKRLGLESKITEILPDSIMIPAVGQGCLALEIREDDENMRRRIKSLDHTPSHQAALAERAFLKTMGGSCQTPLAAYATLLTTVTGTYVKPSASAGTPILSINGFVAHPSGQPFLKDTLEGPSDQAEALGRRLAEKLLNQGGNAILTL